MKLRRATHRYATQAGWTLYAVAMAGLFFVLTFPYDSLHATLLAQLAQRTGLEVRSERWTVQWPAGIAWSHLSLAAPGFPALQADRLRLDLSLASLLQGKPVFEGTGRLGTGQEGTDGLIKTKLSLGSWSFTGPAQILGTIEQLDLARLPLAMVKKGILKSQFEQRWSNFSNGQLFLTGDGTWQVELNGVALEQVPVGSLVIPALTLSNLSGRLVCQAGICRIQSLKGESPDGAFTGEGTLIPRDPVVSSHLSLTVTVTIADALRQRLNLPAFQPGLPAMPLRVTISGPLSNLNVSL
ncbi:MAG: type II secretion system protein GspN [Nitrospirota bacterium]